MSRLLIFHWGSA